MFILIAVKDQEKLNSISEFWSRLSLKN